jgi:hypothetical protein
VSALELRPVSNFLALCWPLPSTPRIALSSTRVELPLEGRRFRQNEWKTLPEFAPEALAGPPAWIQMLLDRQRRGVMDLSVSLAYPVLLLLKPDAAHQAGRLRDQIWDTWGLPVFEQQRDAEGHLLAWECEAHDMFHATEKYPGATVQQDECACGLTRVRLVPREQSPHIRRAAAAD